MTSDKPENSAAVTPSSTDENRVELGPFAEPADFEHGPEFAVDPPRPMPEFTRRCRYVRGRQTTVWTLAMIGSACLMTHPIPFVRTLSWYLLPLGYLNWVGWGLLALAAFYWVRNKTTLGFLEYLRSGKPLTGRIRQVGVKVAGTREAPDIRFGAEVEFRDPDSGQIRTASLSSQNTLTVNDLKKTEAGVVAGEYVTLVYLPGRFEKSLQLYGWTGLNPSQDLIRKNGRPLEPMSPVTALMIVFVVTAVVWGLLAFLYVFERYSTLDFGNFVPFAVGIGLAAIPLIILMACAPAREAATKVSALKRYGGALVLGLFGGFMIGFPTVGFLNGALDRSPPHLEPVEIEQLWNRTINLVIRSYQLEYHPFRPLDGVAGLGAAGKTSKQTVTVETMSLFEPNTLAVIDIGSGWLGMRWLRNFHPVVWAKVADDEKETVAGEIRFRAPNEETPIRIAPQIMMSEKSLLPPPAEMVPELRKRMIANLTGNLQATIIEADKPQAK